MILECSPQPFLLLEEMFKMGLDTVRQFTHHLPNFEQIKRDNLGSIPSMLQLERSRRQEDTIKVSASELKHSEGAATPAANAAHGREVDPRKRKSSEEIDSQEVPDLTSEEVASQPGTSKMSVGVPEASDDEIPSTGPKAKQPRFSPWQCQYLRENPGFVPEPKKRFGNTKYTAQELSQKPVLEDYKVPRETYGSRPSNPRGRGGLKNKGGGSRNHKNPVKTGYKGKKVIKKKPHQAKEEDAEAAGVLTAILKAIKKNGGNADQ